MPVKKLEKKYHFLVLTVVPGQGHPPNTIGSEEVNLELSKWLAEDWKIHTVHTSQVPMAAGQPFAGWYCIYHLIR